jgi:molybdopterin synthase catalytic subunit
VGLTYEAFEPMALAILEQIADEVGSRFGVTRLAAVHRIGEVALGEASVVIVAAAAHREAAFEACRYVIEELKARVPIWKAERFADGSVWLGAPPRPGPPAAGEPAPNGEPSLPGSEG